MVGRKGVTDVMVSVIVDLIIVGLIVIFYLLRIMEVNITFRERFWML